MADTEGGMAGGKLTRCRAAPVGTAVSLRQAVAVNFICCSRSSSALAHCASESRQTAPVAGGACRIRRPWLPFRRVAPLLQSVVPCSDLPDRKGRNAATAGPPGGKDATGGHPSWIVSCAPMN